MTLIAGFECRDGLLMATDLEVSGGERKLLAGKSTWDSRSGKALGLALAGRYDLMVYAAEVLIKANAHKQPLQRVRNDLYKLYMQHIDAVYPEAEKDGVLQVLVGISGAGERRLFVSDRTVLRRIAGCCFVGYGVPLASYLAKQSFSSQQLTNDCIPVIRKIFHEVGENTPYVGTAANITRLDLDGIATTIGPEG